MDRFPRILSMDVTPEKYYYELLHFMEESEDKHLLYKAA